MVGDVRFNDLVKIYQIRCRPNKSKFQERNKNFEEFTDVYQGILSDNSSHSSRLKPYYVNPLRSRYGEMYPRKPLHNIKKIHLEMPVLGAEQAIVTAPKIPARKPLKTNKKVEKKDISLVTEDKITKFGKYETVKPKRSKDGLLKNTHLLLKQTKQETDDSTVQLQAVKTLISQIKPPERIRKSRSPTYKAKKKPDRHSESLSRKYASTLNTMQEKLKKLEDKYFSKPHVVYKNVRDICTTYSDVDVLYENNSTNDDISETLQGIKEQLDFIANGSIEKEDKKPKKTVTFKAPEVEFNTVGDTFDEEKNINSTNFSFKRPLNYEDNITETYHESYSRIIDQTENWFKKYLTKHFDVESLCQDVCNVEEEDKQPKVQVTEEIPVEPPKVEEVDQGSMTDDSDKESNDSQVDHFYNQDKSIFFTKELQAVISSSSYLSREFDRARPSVKVFLNTDNYLREKYFGVRSRTVSSVEPSITDLIDNLSIPLKGSIYYKADTE